MSDLYNSGWDEQDDDRKLEDLWRKDNPLTVDKPYRCTACLKRVPEKHCDCGGIVKLEAV